ncbi:hypothetical protein DPMN_070650 [Dreissena polymorpha]|uniref:Uncharacterized protein n=1 Tax=Dreissena polymorpha TaxID=45954 RepID=A0A9D3Z1D5_DREPO|nr:hypothetical protein DPMN_070650 [Dreissena polymorpha]
MTSEHPGSHFHEDSRIHIRKNAPPPGGHVFRATGTNFELVQDIIGTNLLTKFHNDRTINMGSRVLTRKNATPPWWPYIIGTNLVTKFHDDRTINVVSKENARPPGGQVFKATETLFKLIQDTIGTNLLTKFYYSHIGKNAPPPGGHVFQPTCIIFELVQDIIGMNRLTNFHEDLIETNLLTKFNEDWTINVASRVLTRQMLTPDKRRSQKLTMSTLCSVQLWSCGLELTDNQRDNYNKHWHEVQVPVNK